MEHLIRKGNRLLRRTTTAGLFPLLLAQVLIVLFCVPETLKGGAEIRLELTWEQLPSLLNSEKKVTIMMAAGGAVRSDLVTVLADSIHLGHITKATDWKRHPWGTETTIAKDSVKEIRIENMRGVNRVWGSIAGGAAGVGLSLALIIAPENGFSAPSSASAATILVAPGIGILLGHWLGERKDRETTIITIVD